MRTPHIVLLLIGLVVWTIFSQSSSGHDESSWHPILYDYYHIDLTELGGHQDGGGSEPDEGGFGGSLPVPRDAIVDAINELGIKLLAIHNEHNENNIAISPYGAFSVLAALSEGLEGAAALEILHAAHIPKEKNIIRVGLRDIHRHLKSYFIPEEGFLAGLTLNLNNVSLKSDYEEVLRFYGFDYSSFNNALYPEPPTTKKPAEGTTLETGFGISEEATTATSTPTEQTTAAVETRRSEAETTTTEPTTTGATVSTPIPEDTTVKEERTSSTETPTTIAHETTTKAEETTSSPAATTTEGPITGPPATMPAATETVVTSSEATIVQILETQSSTDKNSEFYSTSFRETISTSFASHSTSESTDSTGKESKDAVVTVSHIETVPVGTDSTTEATTMLTGNTLRTTRDATVFQSEESATEEATTTITEVPNEPTEEPSLTSTSEVPSSSDAPDEVATSTVVPVATESTLFSVTDMEDKNATTSVSAEFSDAPETTTQFFAATDLNYNYEAPAAYEGNVPLADGAGVELNPNLKRSARSVVDYVIARIYDDRPRYVPLPPRPQYAANEPLTFAIYGKYREGGINFMKYDTVLPYYFVHKLSAVALSFPLDSTKYYLLLLLPLRDDGIDQLICDLRIHGSLRYIVDNLKLTHVVATIPSFMLKGYVTLTPTLQRLGVRSIFEPRQADFSPMTNISDIYVTNIEQAVTVTIRNYLDSSAQRYKNFRRYNPVRFKADHPFLYFVVDSELHVALMAGKMINPLNSRIS